MQRFRLTRSGDLKLTPRSMAVRTIRIANASSTAFKSQMPSANSNHRNSLSGASEFCVDHISMVLQKPHGSGGVKRTRNFETLLKNSLPNGYTLNRERRGMPGRFAFEVLAWLVGLSVVLGCLATGILLSTFSSAWGTSRMKKRSDE